MLVFMLMLKYSPQLPSRSSFVSRSFVRALLSSPLVRPLAFYVSFSLPSVMSDHYRIISAADFHVASSGTHV